MKKVLSLVLCGATAAAFALPALSAGDGAGAKGGVNASIEGGASLGGTGVDSGAGGNSAADRPAKPDPRLRVPAQHKDPEERGAASAGSSAEDSARGGTDLGVKADKEDEERRKQERMQRGK